MGNLNETDWDTLWNSEQADRVREKVRHCDRQCWMIGSVSPAMHKYIWVPAAWVIKHKFLRFFLKKTNIQCMKTKSAVTTVTARLQKG